MVSEIVQFLKDTLGPTISDWLNVILIGDMNIKGDPAATTDEWDQVFDSGLVELGTIFSDGWREHMHNPGSTTAHDPGFTQRVLGDGMLNRLDYHLFCKVPPDNRRIVPHHIFVPLREQSDHWSLLSRVQRLSANCTPATAIDLLALTPISTGTAPGHVQSEVRISNVNIQDPGACQWGFVAEPGTYSLFHTANLEATFFSDDDFTHPLLRLDQISMSDLPEGFKIALTQHNPFFPKADMVVSRTPFFIRVRGNVDTFTGPGALGLVKHRGESQATAIVLSPNIQIDPGLPAGQTLGDDDRCWFRAEIPGKFDGGEHTATFLLRNRAGVKTVLFAFDGAGNDRVPAVTSTKPQSDIAVATTGEQVFIVLKRPTISDVLFTMEWQSVLCFLRLDEPIVLHVDDETGPDWIGSDSLEFTMAVDNELLLTDSWDDADSDEDWPDLPKRVRENAVSKAPPGTIRVADISFSSDLAFSLLKTDGISATGSVGKVIERLKEKDPDTAQRKASFTVLGDVTDGQVTFSCTLSKFPSGH